MSRSGLRVVAVASALVLFSVACVQLDDTELEPLRGLEDDTTAPSADVEEIAEGEVDGEVAGESAAADGDVFPEHDGTPFEDLDLPPDEPPPPIEPGGPGPTPDPPSSETNRPPPPPPAPTNFDPASLAAVGSYCELWQIYGSIGAAIDQALFAGPPSHTAEVLVFATALHRRAADLSSERRGDHNVVADVFAGIEQLLGEHGHDFSAFIDAAEDDPALMQRLADIEAPAGPPMDRIDSHVASACGVTLG